MGRRAEGQDASSRRPHGTRVHTPYSTVTLFARFRG
jgi:hypothetical protein